MDKTIGVDLGTNSIGWAIRDLYTENENQIVDAGVLTFDKGVGEGKSGEFPLVQKRTESRGKRRNYQAEKYRKYALLQSLVENKMCPLSVEELNAWRHYNKGVGRVYPQSEKFIQWLRFDFDGDGKPDFKLFGYDEHESHYLFRMLAVSDDSSHREIFSRNAQLLGRVLYHLVQRRGFRGRDEEESKTIMNGSDKNGIAGVDAIAPFIKKHKTLGAALYHLQKEKGGRICKRYSLREDYESELKEICRVNNIAEDLYREWWKAIIWQRPLRSQKGTVGVCTFEKGKARAPISHPLYEEYRTWVFINNLKITLPDTVDRAEYIHDKIYPLFYNASADFKLSKILKELKKAGGGIGSKFKDDTKAVSASLLYRFRELLGQDWKDKYGWQASLENRPKDCRYSFEDIWHVLATFDNRDKLVEFAKKKLDLNDEQTEAFSKIRLQQGYATLSLAAIKKLLPYLQRGFLYTDAVYLANMHRVLGQQGLSETDANQIALSIREIMRDQDIQRKAVEVVNGLISDQLNEPNRYFKNDTEQLDEYEKRVVQQKLNDVFGSRSLDELNEDKRKQITAFVETQYSSFLKKSVTARKDQLFIKTPRLHDRIFNHLQDAYGVAENKKTLLWHPSEQDTYRNAPEKNGLKLLGDPQPIGKGFKNPMALKTLHKLKGLFNHLLLTGKIDEDTRVVIEIARELNDANMRKAIERHQREREKQNAAYRERIVEIASEYRLNLNPADDATITRYRLWVEQNHECLYTGKQISASELFDGTKYDLEHTIPAGMSFDNEVKNLTLADARYNRDIKQKRIPSELPNYNEDAGGYTAIKPRLTFMHEKVTDLEKLVDDWKHKTKFASTKEIKDACIQHRHVLQFELAYWRKKLDTFTVKEYKAGWRNSQLRDTQIVTKYALPYLKTVFKKVEVQKSSVVKDFKIIYNAGADRDEKSRDRHSHHAVDAAVLTLIPPAAVRDKILQRYNDAKDSHQPTYHEGPRGWNKFNYKMLLDMENELLINYQAQHRELTATYKQVRKRGRQQFLKTKDTDGKWHFKLDVDGNRIVLIANGDSVRGQLHKESTFGAIKQGAEMLLVERYPISTFTSIKDCQHIVDKAVRDIVQTELERRIASGLSFEKAKLDPVPFPNGKAVIKRVRCKVAAGRGYLKTATALEVHRHPVVYQSKHEYKRSTYAQNDTNALCLYYEAGENGTTSRAFKVVGLFDLSKLKLNRLPDIANEPYFATAEAGKGKTKTTLPLVGLIQTGCRVIFYSETPDELKSMPRAELSKRLYRVYKFNEVGSPYIYLQHHMEARPNDELGDGDTAFNPNAKPARLKLKADKFRCAIEGKHFIVNPDGCINFLF